jgi:FixJ family two-component response regulator
MQQVAQDPIVIVEDDASVSAALGRLLRLGGFRSRTFTSAEDFLASHASRQAACLVLDIQLAGMTGFELYEHLRATSATQPVIFMSAFDDAVARRRAEAAGAVIFLAKPFSGRSLLDAVQRALSSRQAARCAPLAP